MEVSTVGLDLGKRVFQVHGVDAAGRVKVRRKLQRGEVVGFFAALPPCLVGMEACATAHHWARQIRALGHEVRLIPPAYVKPYVRRSKTDAADAAAICAAVSRPNMRFVPVKSEEQQAALLHHRVRVRDLGGVAGFYRDVLGLVSVEQNPERVTLGAAGTPLLDLVGEPGLAPLDRCQAGLFHPAFLMPDRASLARRLRFVAERRIRLRGASDHGVSEAIYLADPKGNGIEVYADRPVSAWRQAGGTIDMPSDPLDVESLLAAAEGLWTGMPAGGVVGHVHLQVGETGAAERFYRDVLGFEVTCRYPGGSFFGAGGYHHQVAANSWNSRGAGPRPDGMAGIDRLEIVLRDRAEFRAIEARARAAGLDVVAQGGVTLLRDPWGTALALVAG